MKRTTIITAAVTVTLVAGGAGVAAAAAGPFRDDEPLTGEALDRASASALAEAGGGEVVDAEAEDEGGFDVEVRTDGGREVDVRLDENFEVVGRDADGARDDDADDRRLTSEELGSAGAAALAETGGGEVVHVEADDDGTGYEVEVRTEDGAEVDVELDDDFAVTASETDD